MKGDGQIGDGARLLFYYHGCIRAIELYLFTPTMMELPLSPLPLPLLLLLLLLPLSTPLSRPTAQLDPTYLTGTATLISSNWTNTAPTNFVVTYPTIMATSSLNGSVGVMDIGFYMANGQWGWRLVIASLNQSGMSLQLNNKNGSNCLFNLKISFLASYNSLLDINSVAYSFGNACST